MSPFGNECEYANMAACITDNDEKDNPAGYCAELMRRTEEHCKAAPDLYRQKVARVETKVLDPVEGVVRAIVSTEAKDRDGDIIRVAGWELDYFKTHPVLVSSHNYQDLRNQIGEWVDMEVKGKRLEGTAHYMIGQGNEQADWGFQLAVKGRAAFSVGFIPNMKMAKELEGESLWGSYEFNGQELLEVSQVVVPSNPQALQRVKQLGLHPVVHEMVEELLEEQPCPEDDAPQTMGKILELLWGKIEGRLFEMEARLAAATEEQRSSESFQFSKEDTANIIRRAIMKVMEEKYVRT